MRRECFCCGNNWPEKIMHFKQFPMFDVEMWVCPNCEQAAKFIKSKLSQMVAEGKVGVELVGGVECDCPACRAEKEEEKEYCTPTPKEKDKDKKLVKIEWDD
jgi:hypothetical protein